MTSKIFFVFSVISAIFYPFLAFTNKSVSKYFTDRLIFC
ncbi:hypothetical protein SK110_1212 [Lactococcus cremoris]|nr:hypothetical protein SK110_1212 [Lactococcus cremoris]